MSQLEDSNEDEEQFFGGKEGIVFLIDATEPMFDCSQFSLAIQCVENVMKSKAFGSPNDELAVILFGTNKTSNLESYQHISVIQFLQKMSAESILELKQLNEQDFSSTFGYNNGFSLAEVFSLAIEEFQLSKTRFERKRVILFTNTSEPFSGDLSEAKHLREIAIIRANTLDNYNIEFELIPLTSMESTPFDVDAFYSEAFPHLKDDKCDNLNKLDKLLSRIEQPFHKQRTLTKLPFRLGSGGQTNEDSPEVKISINVYNLYIVAKKPNTISINESDFTKVKSKTVVTKETQPSAQSSAQPLESDTLLAETTQTQQMVSTQEVTKNYNFGNDTIILTKNDDKTMKEFEEPALTLLGFKPRTALHWHIHLKPGHFIFPDESTIKGSTTLFNALLKRCAERDKIPICRLTLRRTTPPRLVALYPQIESKPLGKFSGFHVVYLPFKDDVREPDIKKAEQMPVQSEALDLAKDIVNKLTFYYDPKKFPNPVIQTHRKVIEGLALNQTIEPFDDRQTQPNYEDIEKKAGYNMYALNQMLGGYNVQPIERTIKKVAVYQDLSDMSAQNRLGNLTVPELREFCRQKQITCGTRKAELIEAIRSYYKK